MRAKNLAPATLDDCNRVSARYPGLRSSGFEITPAIPIPTLSDLRGSRAPQLHLSAPIAALGVRKQIAAGRLFFQETCKRTKTNRRWYAVNELRREIERWINTSQFLARDIRLPHISDGAVIAAAYLEGFAIKRESEKLEICISLSFTPEYRRLRNKRLRDRARLYSYIFGD